MSKFNIKEQGFSSVAVLSVIVVVVAVGFAGWRVMNNDDNQQNSIDDSQASQLVESLPTDLDGVKPLEEIEQIAGVSDENPLLSFVLETSDNKAVYKIVLADGKKLEIDAKTGAVLSEEMTDVSDDDKLPAGFVLAITPARAYEIASAQSDSPVKSIELEVEDTKVTYKVELEDGSKVEINAANGSIVKAEIKNEDSDDDSLDDSNDDSSDDDSKDDDNGDEADENEQEDGNSPDSSDDEYRL